MCLAFDTDAFSVDVFFFKQKTAYEMRISDWSSDVCSSDLSFRETLEEARRFLSLSMEPPAARNPAPRKHPAGTPQAARRLWAGSKPVAGSLGQAYFLGRRILDAASADALRFHPNCYYRASEDDEIGRAHV